MLYLVDKSVHLTLSTPRTSAPLIPYARVTKPSGQVVYVTLEGASASSPQYAASRQSLVTMPRTLSVPWMWFNNVTTPSDIGRWTWEIWVERADNPGTKVGRQTVVYDVKPATPAVSVGAAIVGILLVVAIAAVAFISTMGTGLE